MSFSAATKRRSMSSASSLRFFCSAVDASNVALSSASCLFRSSTFFFVFLSSLPLTIRDFSAAATAARLGATSFATELYFFIAKTQLSNPPAALDFFLTSSSVKLLLPLEYLSSALIIFSVIPSLSYVLRLFMKSDLPIIFCTPGQPSSLSLNRICTHSPTCTTASAGLAKPFISPMSFFWMFSSAAAAASSAGIASARSASASAFSTAMRAESTLSCSSFAAAAACSASTCAVLLVMTSRSSFTSFAFAATCTLDTESFSCITATSSAAWISFCNPPSRRALKSPFFPLCSSRLFL